MKKIKYLLSFLFILMVTIVLSSCGNSIKEFNFESNYLTLSEGETKKSTQIDNSSKVIYYYSSDETVASVDENGNVTGRGVGDAIVYALFENKPYKCYVKVNEKVIVPDVYEEDILVEANAKSIPFLGDIEIKLPVKMKYNSNDSLLCFDKNLKIQLELDLLKAPETKDGDTVKVTANEQAKKNISAINLILTFINSNDRPALDNFKKVISSYSSMLNLTGEELDNKIKEIGDITLYAYLSNDYLSLAILSKGELKAYLYSNSSDGIISRIKNLVQTINQFRASGTDLQKVDYIELTKNMTGDLLKQETIDSLKKYQDIVSLAAYLILGEIQVNKSTIEEGKPDQRLTLTVSENGNKKISEVLSKKSQILALMKVQSLTGRIDVTKDTNTNYNHFKSIAVNMTVDLASLILPISLSVDLGTGKKSSEEKPFQYEEKHAEFEKKEFKVAEV